MGDYVMRFKLQMAFCLVALSVFYPVSDSPADKQPTKEGSHLYITPATGRLDETDLAVTGYQFVSRTRAGLLHDDYTYTITVTNSAEALRNVIAQATSTSPNTEILVDAVPIGDMDADSSVYSTETFVFRHHRQFLFDPDSIVWTFRADPVTGNTPPVADAGPDQTVASSAVVTLDGSGSSDVDGDPITYIWDFLLVPPTSSAALDDPAAVMPTFTADLPGDYILQLVVNDGEDDSAPDMVTISTFNTPPVADAGLDQTAPVSATVLLSGAGSSDANNDPLTYAWSLITVPGGSTAALSSTNTVDTSFVIDVAGTYVAELIVNDGFEDSTPDTVTITTENTAPVADAGPDQTVTVGETVGLDGSASFDVDDDPLNYSWSLITSPPTSTATITSPGAPVTNFIADVDGTYVVQLIVNDGAVDSAPDTALI
ncbi:MAG: hypothetical protein HKN70_07735, partial [Gammaproteobacteria bacterium]|nr:hypothetical protein [Gammaproteobacteria bacterium]